MERVVVKESEHAVIETCFPCNQLIEMKEGVAMVELTPSGRSLQSTQQTHGIGPILVGISPVSCQQHTPTCYHVAITLSFVCKKWKYQMVFSTIWHHEKHGDRKYCEKVKYCFNCPWY